MNKDLISRRMLVKVLLAERENYPPMVAERFSFGVKLPHHFNQAMRGGIRKALRAVETAPPVDAEPVRHGRWIAQDNTFTRFRCSVCILENYDGYGNYCPNCGAKMDGQIAPVRKCATCKNDGWDMLQCRECNERNGFERYVAKKHGGAE